MGGNPHNERTLDAVCSVARVSLTLGQIVEILGEKFGVDLSREQVRGIIKTLRNHARRADASVGARLLEVDYRRARRSGHYLKFLQRLEMQTSKAVRQRDAKEKYRQSREKQDRREMEEES